MQEISTECDIDAPASTIWDILTDFGRFQEWNPFIRRASGEMRVGGRLEVHIQPSASRETTFRPRVLIVEPNHKLQWLGSLFIRGLFDGKHTFVIETLEGNKSHFIQREEFSGLLVPLILRNLQGDTKGGFEEMNSALKSRAEEQAKRDS